MTADCTPFVSSAQTSTTNQDKIRLRSLDLRTHYYLPSPCRWTRVGFRRIAANVSIGLEIRLPQLPGG